MTTVAEARDVIASVKAQQVEEALRGLLVTLQEFILEMPAGSVEVGFVGAIEGTGVLLVHVGDMEALRVDAEQAASGLVAARGFKVEVPGGRTRVRVGAVGRVSLYAGWRVTVGDHVIDYPNAVSAG